MSVCIVCVICIVIYFYQRWKKELQKNREKVLGGSEKKEKDKKEVMLCMVVWFVKFNNPPMIS